jgi:hypothetical protein
MATDLEKERKERYEKTAKGNFKFIIANNMQGARVETECSSIGQVLHKIRLDLMTMTNYVELLNSKIEITLKLDETKIIDHQHKVKVK